VKKFIKVVKTANGRDSDCYVNMENIAYIHDLQDVRKIHLANGEEITTLMDVDYLLSTSQS